MIKHNILDWYQNEDIIFSPKSFPSKGKLGELKIDCKIFTIRIFPPVMTNQFFCIIYLHIWFCLIHFTVGIRSYSSIIMVTSTA